MTCQRIGRYPIVTMGLGTFSPASRIRIPRPPQKSTTFIGENLRDCVGSLDHDGCPPPKRPVQPIVALQLLDSAQPDVMGEHVARESQAFEALEQLHNSPPNGPFRSKSRQGRRHLV